MVDYFYERCGYNFIQCNSILQSKLTENWSITAILQPQFYTFGFDWGTELLQIGNLSAIYGFTLQ